MEKISEKPLSDRKNTEERLMKCHKKFHLSSLLKAINFSHDSISLAFSFQVKFDLWMLQYLTIIANEKLLLSHMLVSSTPDPRYRTRLLICQMKLCRHLQLNYNGLYLTWKYRPGLQKYVSPLTLLFF